MTSRGGADRPGAGRAGRREYRMQGTVRLRGWQALCVPALAVSWLLPASGVGLYLRLAFALMVVLLPGAALARALRTPGVSGILAWTCASLFGALLITFAARGSIWLALALHLGAGVAALPFAARVEGRGRAGKAARRTRVEVLDAGLAATAGGAGAGSAEEEGDPEESGSWRPRAAGLVLLLGVVFGMLLWKVAGQIDGDALFHLARVRKLDAFGDLSLRTLDEFRDGGLHPGYAFPLWHGLLALVAKVAAVDPALVVGHLASVLAPLAFAVAYEAGVAVFRTATAGFAALAGQVAISALAAGHGGSFTSLALPGTASRQLLVPAAIALFFLFVRRPRWQLAGGLVGITLGISLSHPTYTLFLLVPLGGFVAARALLARGEDLKAGLGGLLALGVPWVLISLWLLPLVRDTVSHSPAAVEKQRALAKYAGQIDVSSLTSYHLAPELLARTGSVAVIALAGIPLALLAVRKRWAAFVLGGSLAVLALMLVPFLFTHFSDVVSLSQSRRAGGFIPFAFAFAGVAVLAARLLGPMVLPLALVSGILLQRAYPGDFGYSFGEGGGPGIVTWIGALGGAAALVAGIALRRSLVRPAGLMAALAATLFVLPVAVHGFRNWTPAGGEGADRLSPGLVQALRTKVPKGDIVWSEPQTSYSIAAWAPVYIAVAPPGHVADTRANRPYDRYADAAAFRQSGDLAIPRMYGAHWIVTDAKRKRRTLPLSLVYQDERYALYRLTPA